MKPHRYTNRPKGVEETFINLRNEKPAVDNTPTWARMVIGAIVVIAAYVTLATLLILAIF